MDQLLQEQNKAEGTNMTAPQMDATVGSVLSFLKSKGVDMDKVKKALPQAEALVGKAETENASRAAGGGGMLGKLGGLIAGASPANATTTEKAEPAAAAIDSMPGLLTSLQGAGVDAKQVESFLPMFAGFLKKKGGVDVSSELGVAAPAGGGGIMGNLRGAASNLVADLKKETTGSNTNAV